MEKLQFYSRGMLHTVLKKLGRPAVKFILETWVKATTLNNNDDHLGTNFAVVAFRNATNGYLIAQQGSNWVAVIDGKSYVMAPVLTDAWIHLALVNENGKGCLYSFLKI